ncbi:hydantoinase/oxoprolinase family protein [Ramlibacter sp. G-1-2-2]|uniref:Hydantoinase/oxoprolinase family protein n=1 Tax=Ramlibacter agri TaxID=2728837 RepID=A0A848H8I7_9BURK|nr:hydantoinase/oxoprolinase family protein [Ramlibacter agri]NML45710.1 hydantoinase/oxoprolinase family protein [Ramlibacter agri]
MSKLLGIDVGGTFTDLFLLDEATGEVRISKASTTPGDQATGLFNAMAAIDVQAADINLFIHGTTIATNALIERKGAACGMITTRGFRDVLELGRRDRPHLYGMTGLQDPLIPRWLRLEVLERMGPDGAVIEPLDEAAVLQAARVLRARGAEAIVVCFLHSYANPAHERRARDLLREAEPDCIVNLSSDLLPQIYELERFSTAAIHTYLQPLVSRYVDALRQRLSAAGYRQDVLFVQSSGGVMSSATARQRPANLALSGPAAGVMAASYVAEVAGFENVISADMGGTSFDVCLIPKGRPRTSDQTELGFRMPLRAAMIDIHTIGAGGGSIARVDRGGILQVGPESAGAMPGPAAYGRGGVQPTVTDANLVIGHIGESFAFGGQGGMKLDRQAAESAIRSRVAEPLGLAVEEAARAIVRLANHGMAGRIRAVSIERGYDPREFALVAYGGAGPMHAAALMKDVGIGRCVIPYYPGVLCALGSAAADVRQDIARTVMRDLDTLDFPAFAKTVDEMVQEGARLIQGEGVPVDRVDVLLAADMGYEGQRHDIRVNLPAALSRESVRQAFEQAYQLEYRQILPRIGIRLTALRVMVLGVRPRLNIAGWFKQRGRGIQAPPATRPLYVEGEWRTAEVHQRDDLGVGAEVFGPAIIEQRDSTVVVDAGTAARVDAHGNLVLEMRSR